jgi:sugar/nucleoside kinase (ribokinase family)
MSTGILNIGICTVDAIGQYVDEFPPPGGLRTFDNLTLTTGGCAMNCSVSLAKMGLDCRMIVKVGGDILGRFVLDEARRHGIGTEGVISAEDEGTPFTFVCVQRGGQRSFIHTTGTNATLCLDEIDMDLVRSSRFCSVSGAMVMPEFDGEQTAELLRLAREGGAATLLDTVYTDAADQKTWQAKMFPALPHVDYFVPSEPEARAMTGLSAPGEMARALQQQGARHVVIKLGERGAFCLDADGGEQDVAAYRIDDVVDTTGAGDAWVAGFLAGLSDDASMTEAARLGNAVAAHCIQAAGATAGVVGLARIRHFQEITEVAG